jgi:hypothetical protein
MNLKRRSFFQTIFLAIASVFIPRRVESTIPSVGHSCPKGPLGCPSGPRGPLGMPRPELYGYEGRTIPNGVVVSQVVGRINKHPYYPQAVIETAKLRSTIK